MTPRTSPKKCSSGSSGRWITSSPERWTAGSTGSPPTSSCDQARRKSRIRFDGLSDEAEARLPGKDPGPERSFEFNNLDIDVQTALEELPPDFRAAVVLCDLEGVSYEEVSAALDIKLGLSARASTAAGPCFVKSSRTGTRAASVRA